MQAAHAAQQAANALTAAEGQVASAREEATGLQARLKESERRVGQFETAYEEWRAERARLLGEVAVSRRERQNEADTARAAAGRAAEMISELRAQAGAAAVQRDETLAALDTAREACGAARTEIARLSERLASVEERAARSGEAAAEQVAELREFAADAGERLRVVVEEREGKRRAAAAMVERVAMVSAERTAAESRCERAGCD
jgi:chromosome segregation ATPase